MGRQGQGSRAARRVGLRALAAGLVLAALASCRSTAPYTVPATALNTAAAVGLSAQQRLKGGCYAACTNGTVCNTHTGYCVPASEGNVCIEDGSGGMRCTPFAISGTASPAPPPTGLTIGVSPATGSVPPPPAESSPRAP